MREEAAAIPEKGVSSRVELGIHEADASEFFPYRRAIAPHHRDARPFDRGTLPGERAATAAQGGAGVGAAISLGVALDGVPETRAVVVGGAEDFAEGGGL